MGPVIGIDLGTTNTVIASSVDGAAETIVDAAGDRLIPSVVSFHPNGSVVVGRSARERRLQDPKNTVYSVKRLIGRSWKSNEVTLSRQRFAFDLREGPGSAALVVARGETYTLPEISAFVLRKAKQIADAALGTTVERAVITVPANFNDLQRAATKVAGRVAGLEVLRILNEPTAAALAYGYGKDSRERLAVYDFGGGTFDVTLLDLSGNVFEVLATAGDTFLGGDDIDLAIAERMAEQLLREHRVDASQSPEAQEKLRAYAEDVKKALSVDSSVTLEVPEVAYGRGGRALNLAFSMTRGDLESMAAPIIERTFDVCRDALSLARLEPGAFDEVLLVGGSTRMPLVRQQVERFFGRTATARISPDEVVAIGAAIQGAALSGLDRRHSRIPPPPRPAAADDATLERLRTRRGVGSVPPPPPGAPPPGPPPGRARSGSVPPPRPGSVPPPGPPPGQALTQRGTGAPRRSRPPPLPSSAPPRGDEGRGTLEGLGEAAAAAIHSATTAGASSDDTLVSAAEAATEARRRLSQTGDRASDADVEARYGKLPLTMPDAGLAGSGSATSGTDVGDVLDDDDDDLDAIEAIPLAGTPAGDAELLADVEALEAPEAVPDGAHRPAGPGATQVMAAALAPAAAVPGLPAPDPHPAPVSPAPPGMPAPMASPIIRERPPEAPLLVDVTPLSLGVETVGGYCDAVIERNTQVPCETTRSFATARDGQTAVRVRVAQGESRQFGDNTLLGEIELADLRHAPRGQVEIAVTFGLDTDGILNVRALETATGRAATATVRLVGLTDVTGDVDELAARHAARQTV